MKRIFLASPHMGGEELFYVNDAFEKNWIAPLGENVDEFEKEVASRMGAKCGAALSAGTAAIHMAMKAAGVGQGDVVFCPSLTFSATVNPVVYQNATPVFIDCDPDNWGMSPEALEKAYEKYPNPKAVIIVHLYGQACKIDEIVKICREHGTTLIEDAAESMGTKYNGKETGTFGKFGIYSFNGNKIITTSGGGMLVSDDEEAIAKVRFWSTQSRDKARHYQHSELGYNYRMSNIVAGIGRGQLKVLDKRIEQKTEIYYTYKKAFEDIPEITMNPVTPGTQPNFWLSCISVDESSPVKPGDIIDALEAENIESRPIWKPMHMQPYYEKNDFITMCETGSNSERIFLNGVCLPSDTKMTKEEQGRVIETVIKCFESRRK